MKPEPRGEVGRCAAASAGSWSGARSGLGSVGMRERRRREAAVVGGRKVGWIGDGAETGGG